ncbi:hypothetical protein EDB85DRAFT_1957832 [Lactarius pseudohatsudake]|nr:hypothetical protein EDB85DRAFT_1957832 [Lactarius pseudohatsudake]
MSYRSDSLGGYDHTLLSSVPGPTRAEKQEGYNVDLLEESRDRRAPSPPANGAASDHNGTLLDYSPGAIGSARKEDPITATTDDYEPVEKRVPWYRTRKGLIGIVVVVLVRGVGGTRHSSTLPTATPSTGVGQSANSAAPGVGEGSSTSSTASSPSSNTLGQAETARPQPSGGVTGVGSRGFA